MPTTQSQNSIVALDRAAELLNVSTAATDQELRAAYLRKVQQHPPDRDPDLFEKIRDAYEQLRNPDTRARLVLQDSDFAPTLESMLDGLAQQRPYVGSQLWIDLLKEKRP